MAPTDSTPRSPHGRIEWVDVAKGFSITAVVFYHAVIWTTSYGVSPFTWWQVTLPLSHLRMPLFFMLSGLFAAKILSWDFGTLARTRLWLWSAPYLLWFPLLYWVLRMELSSEPGTIAQGFRSIIFPDTGIWFLSGLILYTVVTWALRGVPPLVVVGGGMVVAALMPWAESAELLDWTWARLASFYFCFAVGVHFRALVLRLAGSAQWIAVVLLLGVLYAAERFLDDPTAMPETTLAFLAVGAATVGLSMCGMVTGVWLAVRLTGTIFRRPLAYVGRHTLEIYLLNEIILALLLQPVVGSWASDDTAFQFVTVETFGSDPGYFLRFPGLLAPIYLSIVSILLALAVRRVLRLMHLDALFVPPLLGAKRLPARVR